MRCRVWLWVPQAVIVIHQQNTYGNSHIHVLNCTFQGSNKNILCWFFWVSHYLCKKLHQHRKFTHPHIPPNQTCIKYILIPQISLSSKPKQLHTAIPGNSVSSYRGWQKFVSPVVWTHLLTAGWAHATLEYIIFAELCMCLVCSLFTDPPYLRPMPLWFWFSG